MKIISSSKRPLISTLQTQGSANHHNTQKSSNKIGEEKFKSSDVSKVKLETSEDVRIASEIKRMKAWEAHVIAHERMHMLAGGGMVGAPSYVYKMGPDGKAYITGGEVTLYVPKAASLEGSEASLSKLKAAALAPLDPSPKDMAAAAMATSIIERVRKMIHKKQMTEAYEKSQEIELSIKQKNGEAIDALDKFNFSHIVAFELMV